MHHIAFEVQTQHRCWHSVWFQVKHGLPLAKAVSDEFFELSRPTAASIDTDTATFEGLLDRERNIALVQWAQFIEHDLARTVFQTMGMHHIWSDITS